MTAEVQARTSAGVPSPGRTLRDALRSAERRLAAAGVPSPRPDAESLACHLLGIARGELWWQLEGSVPVAFDDLVERRADRIPLQHLTGYAHLRTVTLSVGPGVFLPRPETEVVVGHALAALDSTIATPVVVDLCAGSGAIAAAVRAERPGATVHAVERDPGAAPWLRHNARVHCFAVHVDDVSNCLQELNQRVDLVIANPPYIPQDAVPRDPEVSRFDPAMSLYSGVDGLDHIRMVEAAAARLLKSGGTLVVEHGDLQGEIAPTVFARSPHWSEVQDHVDLNGRDRYVTASRRATPSGIV